ncbi:glycosyltransferase involved in cell wall biosynthesis [Ectopseudomonas oleovorans]|uniref:Glycosyltransferase involved in cell wall biosynthesis n=1 Tax=Ectopseudomonas oleovorans TaxID=301 RepID=A0A397NB63_ECTOL|nr:glycosyltransferase [Pseudomonas oleovorans]RIA34626.1 glycosyltransferase involved in cell wall biosynthesis [Pseudomonas oleovorans]
MKHKVKVLQLQPDYNVKAHDFADLAEQVVKAFPAERYEVVSAYLGGRPHEGQPASVAERSVYFGLSGSQLKGMRVLALWRLFRFCRAERFDVVICNRFKAINMMLWLNRWLRIPNCIGITHGFGEYKRAYRRWQTARMIDESWRFVAVSSAVKDYLLRCRCGFAEKNTVVINNAIDIDKARALQLPRGEARASLGLSGDAFVFGAIGRLVPVKGHIHLVEAFAKCIERLPGALLVIIGEGRSRIDLEAAVERLGLHGRVLLPGAKADALQYIRAFDVFVMPSLSEGLPLALLEAMSGELPVIASDIPAMLPILKGAGGLAVGVGDVKGLAEALAEHFELSRANLYERGLCAFSYLQQHHGIEQYRSQYLALVDDCSR